MNNSDVQPSKSSSAPRPGRAVRAMDLGSNPALISTRPRFTNVPEQRRRALPSAAAWLADTGQAGEQTAEAWPVHHRARPRSGT